MRAYTPAVYTGAIYTNAASGFMRATNVFGKRVGHVSGFGHLSKTRP